MVWVASKLWMWPYNDNVLCRKLLPTVQGNYKLGKVFLLQYGISSTVFVCREMHLGAISATTIELWNGRDMSIFRLDGGARFTASGSRSLSLVDDGNFVT